MGSGKVELSADYGSGKRNLQYFRKRKSRGRKNSMRITEVVNKTCLTSVKSEQGRRAWGAEFTEVGRETCNTSVKLEKVRGLGEQNLRKWAEKSALLP